MCVSLHLHHTVIDIDECTEYQMICGYNTMCINEVVNHTKGFTCHCLQGYEESVLGDCEG